MQLSLNAHNFMNLQPKKMKLFTQMAKFTNIDPYQCHGRCSVFIH